jgi:uncharacterized protein (TIGR03663 family)
VTGVATPAARAAQPDGGARRRRTPREWYAEQDQRELLLWGLLIAAAILVRFIGLGNRPFHHDESQDAYFSYTFRTSGHYEYNPLLHGPLRFYMTAAMYVLFGDSNFTARLAPALMGIAMVALPFGLRNIVGRGAALATAALLAFEPTYLYFSRFAREDIYFACLTLALIVVIFRFLSAPRRHHPALIGAVLALSFATKETTLITVFVMGSFFLVALAVPATRQQVWGPVSSVGWEAWGWCFAVFGAIFTLFFTSFLMHPGGLWDGIYTGPKYWLNQQPVHRGGEPRYFYLVVLFGEEWPVLLLAAVGAAVAWRKHTLLVAFLVWDFVVSLLVYSWASEKFAWLVMHPLLPLLLLAGLGLQGIWEARRAPIWRGVGIAAALVGLFYLGISSYWVNVKHGADPRELLVSTQSSTQVKQVADQVVALAASRGPGKPPLTITVDAADGATFPYAWYFRHLAAGYIDESLAGAQPPTSDVIILTDASKARLAPALAGYDGRRFDFRVWWVRDYGAMSPENWWNWFTKRQVWNPTGGMNEWLYVRKGL